MKSKPGKNYIEQREFQISESLNTKMESLKDSESKKGINSILKYKKEVEFMKHLINKISGGEVESETEEDVSNKQFLDGMDKIFLPDTDQSSYLDYATYIKLRRDKNKKEGKGDKESAKEISKELKEIQELLDEMSEEAGNGKDGNDKEKVEKSSELEKILGIYKDKLSNLTWLISRVMSDFIPEIGDDITDLKEDVEGEERLRRKMLDLSELAKADPFEIVGLPEEIFLDKAANNDFSVNTKASGKEKKQFVYLLIDGSGSMNDLCNVPPYDKWSRASVVREICATIAERVREENCVVYLRVYREQPELLMKVEEKSDYEAFIKYLECEYKPRGGTKVDKALHVAINDINEMIELNENLIPEILLITDGDDDVYIKSIPSPITLNYINVDKKHNETLLGLSHNFIAL